MFYFKKQMEVGDKGESLFKKYYDKKFKVGEAEDRSYDCSIILNDKTLKVEIKTDTYPMTQTPNFFMEYYSDIDKQSVGGPWRAAKDKIDYFIYFYLNDNTFFWFEPKKLCQYLDNNLNKFNKRQIRNKGWTTMGYLVRRSFLSSKIVRLDTFNKKKKK